MKKMNSGLKKFVVTAVLGISLMNMVPQKSHAIVGLATGAVPLMIVGGGMAILGVPLGVAGLNHGDLTLGLGSILGIIVGIVVLDDQHQVSPHFTILNAESAQTMGINSANELNAYNTELPAINAINQTITSETLRFNRDETTLPEIQSYIVNQWSTYGQMISPDAQSALKKVQAHISAQLSQASTN